MHLVKFIIDLKGDIFRDLMSLKLNVSPIEQSVNLLDPLKIGLKKKRGVRYKPYELERYRASFQLLDGSTCMTALYQISLRVSTTKRRSSGKVKTKFKYKHKFLYVLTLKLKESDYNLLSLTALNSLKNVYNIAVTSEDGYHLIKLKLKEKRITLTTKPKFSTKIKASNFTKMLDYLRENKIFEPIHTNLLKH